FASGGFGFSLSRSGDLAYLAGGIGKSRLVWYDRSGRRLESVGPTGAIYEPMLSPDGLRATISMADRETTASNILLIDLVRGGVARLSDQQPAPAVTSLFSHDGATVVYSTFPSGRIFARDVSGSAPSRLLFEPGVFSILEDWAPDGRLFFTELELTTYHMQSYVLPPGARKAEPLLTGPANYEHTRLSPAASGSPNFPV